MSKPEVLKFDCSDLLATQAHAHMIINSSSPVPNSYSPSPPPTPSAGFKPPRIEIPKWSGKNYDFYTWTTACSRSFETTQCPEGVRTQLMTLNMTLDKTPQFNNITNWTNF